MGLKVGQNINFRPNLVFTSVFGRDTVFFCRDQVSWSRHNFLVATKFPCRDTVFLVVTKFPGRDTAFWSRPSFLVATQFLDNNLFFFSKLSGP